MDHSSNCQKLPQPPQGGTLCQSGPHPIPCPLLPIKQGGIRSLTPTSCPSFRPPHRHTWDSLLESPVARKRIPSTHFLRSPTALSSSSDTAELQSQGWKGFPGPLYGLSSPVQLTPFSLTLFSSPSAPALLNPHADPSSSRPCCFPPISPSCHRRICYLPSLLPRISRKFSASCPHPSPLGSL